MSVIQVEMQGALRFCLGHHEEEAGAELRDLPHWPKSTADDTELDDIELDDWILRNIDDEAVRKAYLPRLVATAHAFQFSGAVKLASLGDMYSANVK
jgi:hypothetical protein